MSWSPCPDPVLGDRVSTDCDRDADRAARGRPGRDDRAARSALHQAADGRPVHLLRPDGAGGVPDRPGHRRAPPPAHQPRDADLPVRGRDPAPRQPGDRAGDPTRCGELDVRRARHRPFRAHERGAPPQGPAPVRHPDLDGAAGRAGGGRPRVRAPWGGRAAHRRCRRRSGAADRGTGLRGRLAAGDRVRDALRRRAARGGRPGADRGDLRGARALHRRR